ncbi:MAG: hypothetical protein U0992_00330 [Planctomycetaceae bacterium]
MSSSPFDLSFLLGRLIGASPGMLVGLAGLVLCLTRDSRPLRARLAVGGALAIHLFASLIMPLIYGYILPHFQTPASGGSRTAVIVVGLISSSMSAVALGLLLYAAFTNDDRPSDAGQT